MYNYLIKLTPHDTFFFGTGKEFGAENQNYFVKSGYFPQQTTLLGMLRYQLLCQADDDIFSENEIKDKGKARDLIGAKSFTKGEKRTFGTIKRLSSMFLMKGNKKLFPLSKEFQKDTDKYLMKELSKDLNLLENYNPKYGLPELWIDEDKNIYSLEDIFTAVEKVGIRKNYEGKTDDNAFYMQTFRKFRDDDFSFAFFVECEVKIEPNNLVFVGGERQSFNMEVKEVNKDFKVEDSPFYIHLFNLKEKKDENNIDCYQSSKNAHKVVLISDAYLEDITEKTCDFAITETVGFRCLISEVEKTENFYSIPRSKKTDEKKQDYKDYKEQYKEKNLYKSEQIELYKRGSVFYFSDESKLKGFTEKLTDSEFYTIGYNHFITIKKQ